MNVPSSKMMRVAGWSVVALFLAAFCTFIFCKDTGGQSIRMPAGNVVTLMGVTSGTNDRVVWGKPYQRLLYGILPKKYQHFSKAVSLRIGNGAFVDSTFWLDISAPPTDAALANAKIPSLFVRLVDESGCQYDSSVRPFRSTAFIHSAHAFCVIGYFSGPHGKIVGLLFYDSADKTHELGSFWVPGAQHRDPVESVNKSGTTSPQSRDASIDLVSFRTGMRSAHARQIAHGTVFTQAIFHVAGAPIKSWHPDITVSDAHGKSIVTKSPLYGFKNGDIVFNFEGALDPADGPFKVSAGPKIFEKVQPTVALNGSSK